jgi:hypothetical protein
MGGRVVEIFLALVLGSWFLVQKGRGRVVRVVRFGMGLDIRGPERTYDLADE